jgi:site-specific DNA-methyltransferase (adenine-specific)
VSLVYTYKVDPTQITFFVDHPAKVMIAERIGVSTITKLDPDTDYDVILCNPPYNDNAGEKRSESKNTNNSNIYYDTMLESFEYAPTGIVSMIVPAAWMTNKIKDRVLDAGLKSIRTVDRRHFPNGGVRTGLSMFHTDKLYTGDIEVHTGTHSHTIKRDGVLSFEDPTRFNILAKIAGTKLTTRLKRGPYAVPKGTKGSLERLVALDPSYNIKEGPHKVMMYPGGFRTAENYVYSTVDKTVDKFGLAFPGVSDTYIIGKVRLVEPGVGVSDRMKVMYFDGKEEALNFKHYVDSKLIKFVIKTTKINDTVNTDKNSFDNIPLIDYSRKWTDKELYDLFDITDAEAAYIESDVMRFRLTNGSLDVTL